MIWASEPATVDERGLTFTLRLEPGGEWKTDVVVAIAHVVPGVRPARPTSARDRRSRRSQPRAATSSGGSRRRRASSATGTRCGRPTAGASSTSRRSASRRSAPAGAACPAAGLPWFMTMFGRDSIFTSLQALPVRAASSRRRRCASSRCARARAVDDFRDEDPGKILHEHALRRADRVRGAPALAVLRHRGRDAALRRPARRVRALDRRPEARARARARGARRARVDRRPRRPRRRTATSTTSGGTRRRGSRTSAGRTRGTRSPTATARLPGLPARDVRAPGLRLRREGARRAARARVVWRDAALADRLEREATELKRRFNRDFWVADGEYYALALERDGSQVDSLIVEHRAPPVERDRRPSTRAESVARHLMGPRLYSGWGVRTLAEGEARYNPIGYHVGTVWPFDNSFIAWGLRALRLPRRGRASSLRACSTRPSTSRAACPRPSPATSGR